MPLDTTSQHPSNDALLPLLLLSPPCHTRLKNQINFPDKLLSLADERLDLVVMRLQTLIAVVVIMPFSLWRIQQNQWHLAAVGLTAALLLGILGALSWNTNRFDRWVRQATPWVVACQMAAIGMMVALAGSETKTWIFPVIVSAFLLLRAKEATLITLVSSLVVAVLAYRNSGEARDSAIFFASCLLVLLFTHLFASRLNADNQQLKTRALQDALTGVGNRRLLDDTLSTLVTQAHVQTPPQTLIMLDMDHFKTINDRFGHNVGDVCLRRFSQAVQALLPAGDEVFRFGGEEFVVLCQGNAQTGQRLAEHIRQHIEQTSIIREAKFTVSAGVAQHTAGQSVREWLNQADTALYRAKESGRNQVLLA